MTKNPLINALSAALYIALVASLMYYGPKAAGPVQSVVVPMAMLSLFVLSAATMGYLFLSKPLQLYLDGEKSAAIRLFVKTLAAFAVITLLFFAVLFIKSSHS